MKVSFYLDMIPVLLAIYAIYRLSFVRRTLLVMLSKLAAIVLIICQTTWIHSYLNNFPMIVSAMDNLWTVFNILAMTIVILIAKQQESICEQRRPKI